MTTVVKQKQSQNQSLIWTSAPGWGIVADLTPPELVDARRLSVLRKRIGAALAVLVVMCGAGYSLALRDHSFAEDALSTVQDRTTALRVQQNGYRDVTQTEAALALKQKQTATLMAADVETSALLVKLRAALPGRMTIKNLSVDLAAASIKATAGSTATGLDASGRATIGTAVIGGSALAYADVSRYVDTLASTAGLINVVPTSAQADQGGVQYNITFNLTDVLLSHRFDLAETGGTP